MAIGTIIAVILGVFFLGIYFGWFDQLIPGIDSLIHREDIDSTVQGCNSACDSIPAQAYAYCQKNRKFTLPDKKKTEGTCYEFSNGEKISAMYSSYFRPCEKINCEEFLNPDDEDDSGNDNKEKLCGNNKLDDKEECDGENLNQKVCKDVNSKFTDGTLSCGEDCKFDTSKCTPATTNTPTAQIGVNSFIKNKTTSFQIYKSGSTSEIISSSIINFKCYQIFQEGTDPDGKERYLIGIIDSKTKSSVNTGWIPKSSFSTYWQLYSGTDSSACGW